MSVNYTGSHLDKGTDRHTETDRQTHKDRQPERGMFTNCFTQHSQTILCSNVFAYLPGGPFIVNGSEGLQQTSQITSYYHDPQQVKKQQHVTAVAPSKLKQTVAPSKLKQTVTTVLLQHLSTSQSAPPASLNKSKCSCSTSQQVKVLLQHLSTSQSAPAASLNKSKCSCSISQQVKVLQQCPSISPYAFAASLSKSKHNRIHQQVNVRLQYPSTSQNTDYCSDPQQVRTP